MEAMRKAWTDERLDDMNRRMEGGFNRVDADIRSLRAEMNARFERVESRIDEVNRTMLRLGGGAIATFVAGFAGMIATQL